MKNKETWVLIASWLLAAAALLSFALFCSGCYTKKAATRQRDKIDRNYPAVLANYCATKYPASLGDPYVITNTDTITKVVNRDCDSLAESIAQKYPGIDLKALIDSLKDYRITTHNYYTTDSVFIPVRDSALVASLTLKIDKLTSAVQDANIAAAKSKSARNILLWVLGGVVVVCAVSVYFLFRSIFRLKTIT